MDLDNLASAQEEMRERWADKRKNPKTGRLTCSEYVEADEIREMAERTDLVCLYCKVNPTRSNRRTGEVMPCGTCKSRLYYVKKKNPGVRLRPFSLEIV